MMLIGAVITISQISPSGQLEYLANIVKVTDPFTATLYVFLFKFFSDHNLFDSLRIIKLSLEALTLNNGIILKGITHA